MRIGMIAPLEMRVPPVAYGGTELLVSLLTEGLVKQGHEVTLFASGDSRTAARLISVCGKFLRGTPRDKSVLNILNVVACLERADEFDIIHNHTQLEGLSTAGLVRTPMLTTLHGNLKDDWLKLFRQYRGWYNTISISAKRLLPDKERFAGVIYNAIDVTSYPYNGSAPDDYMLFLSRISREKGTHIAIEVARRLGRKIIIAGNIDTTDRPYFEEEVLPLIDNDLIRFVGEANYSMKRKLMSGAYCLLAPITWDEPFGLFLVESMACGTPVIIFNRGSAPEVIAHGVTGYIVETVEEMAGAVGKIGEIDRKRCRQHVKLNFDVPRMVNAYLDVYSSVQEEAGTKRRREPIETGTQYL